MSEPLLDMKALREVEQRYNSALGDFTLMERAGSAAAKLIASLTKAPASIIILCGPGNNGGDGFVCATVLKAAGYRVTCVQPGGKEPKEGTPAARAKKIWEEVGGLTIADPYDAPKADVVVDAMFGIGLSKPLGGVYADAAQWFNERQAFHVAIDIPSGLDSQTGRWIGTIGCHADATITFLAGKPGLFTAQGPDACGHVHTDNLGVSIPLSPMNLIEPEDFREILLPRVLYTSKKNYGKAGVIGGGKGTVGASVIAGTACLRMGAGAVYMEILEDAPGCIYTRPELMIRNRIDFGEADVLIVGPGLGFTNLARIRLNEAIDSEAILLLDADALTMVSQDDDLLDRVAHRKGQTVITPHPGEASRLLKCTVQEIEKDRVKAAQEIAVVTGAITVLKGTGTVIAQRSGKTWICPTGTPALATAGSGDALCGIIGAFLAQKYNAVPAVLAGVYLHGAAAEGMDFGLLSDEIADKAAECLRKLRKETSKFGISLVLGGNLHGRVASHKFWTASK
ncbi:MAG: NAD(P)H-hydrate dehydratase [Burkholderiales bacterium]|nr:NAD(P)H-hydrate dehydratase [Burkholderiales bacterium]